MSQVVAEKIYLIETALGNMRVDGQLLTQYDIDDLVHAQAISQAELCRLANIGQNIDANAILPPNSLPAIYANNTEELPD